MKVLVVGSGGREHALVWKIAQSPRVKRIFCAPGNAGIARIAECVRISASDRGGLRDFAVRQGMDLTVVGPEAPLVDGLVDDFQSAGLKIFGPCQEAAKLEASKIFSKELMRSCGVATADFEVCADMAQAEKAILKFGAPLVIKADGLAAGKGVVICRDAGEARAAAQDMLEKKLFGDAGRRIVVEECLQGEEASILVLTNGRDVVALASSQDHKRAYDGDQGPNTGGMGAYSPAPVVTETVMQTVLDRVVRPVLAEMEKRGTPYRGLLYAGIMLTPKGAQVLEFNVRFGDPETQAVLARLDSDLVEAMLWSCGSNSDQPSLRWKPQVCVCVVAASAGYPGSYEKGRVIEGLDSLDHAEGVIVFHAGTKMQGDRIVTDGGRVFGVSALGKDLSQARSRAYEAIGKISFEGMQYRRDIGWRAMK